MGLKVHGKGNGSKIESKSIRAGGQAEMSTMQYLWLATLNTSRTVLTTKDNKKDDSYRCRLLQISAAGGMQKGTNGDESDCARTSKNSYR